MNFMNFSKSRTDAIDSILQQEIQIWGNLKAGDKKALSYIYTRYFDGLYNYGTRITKDASLAEDCIQDMFIELWDKRETLSNVRNLRSYLYRSLRRKILYKLSAKARQTAREDLSCFEIELSDKTHFLNQQVDIEIRKRLASLVGMLTPKQKEAIFLIYYDGLSYEETASVMSLKTKTVYNLIHLAVSKLRGQRDTLSLMSFTFPVIFFARIISLS